MANLQAFSFIVPKVPTLFASGSVALAILTACITGGPQAFADNPSPAQQPPTSAASTGSPTATTDAPQPVKQPAVDNTAASGQPAPGPVQLARESFNVACPNGGCSAALQKEHAAALTNAVKGASLSELDVVLDLVKQLVADALKGPSPFVGVVALGKQIGTRLADRELKTRLDEHRWSDARAWIAQQAEKLGGSWEKSGHAAEGRTIEAYARAPKPQASLEALVALTKEYAPLVAVAQPDASLKRAYGVLQARIGNLVDPALQAHLAAYEYGEASGLISTYAVQAGTAWQGRSEAAVARRKSVTTELVDVCSKERSWDACRNAFSELVSACSSSEFTCNPTAKAALRQQFVPMFSKEPATDEVLLELGRAVRGLAGLKPQDALKQVGDQADAVVRRHVEASIRNTAKESDYSAAKKVGQNYASDFGEKWVAQMGAVVDAEERRQIAIAEAKERAEAAHAEACVQLCMHTPTQCPEDPWHMCLLGRSDCEMLGPMVCGLMGK